MIERTCWHSAKRFPTFMKKIEALAGASKNYQAWMGQAGYKRTSGKDAAQINAGLLEVYTPYVDRRNELLEDLKKYAVENFR
jgi:hypothetical protein